MGIKVQVFPGEKVTVGYLWHAVVQQAIIIREVIGKDASGNDIVKDIYNRNSFDHPRPDTWPGWENTGDMIKEFTIMAYNKNPDGPLRRGEFFYPNLEREIGRGSDGANSVYFTIGTEDGFDSDFYDAVFQVHWENFNRPNTADLYTTFVNEDPL